MDLFPLAFTLFFVNAIPLKIRINQSFTKNYHAITESETIQLQKDQRWC